MSAPHLTDVSSWHKAIYSGGKKGVKRPQSTRTNTWFHNNGPTLHWHTTDVCICKLSVTSASKPLNVILLVSLKKVEALIFHSLRVKEENNSVHQRASCIAKRQFCLSSHRLSRPLLLTRVVEQILTVGYPKSFQRHRWSFLPNSSVNKPNKLDYSGKKSKIHNTSEVMCI